MAGLDIDTLPKTVLGCQAAHVADLETAGASKNMAVRIYSENQATIFGPDAAAVHVGGLTSKQWQQNGRLVQFSITSGTMTPTGITAGNYDAQITGMTNRIYDYYEALGANQTTEFKQCIFTWSHEPEGENAANY